MESKKPSESKVLWFNIPSITALALTALMASPEFLNQIGPKGYIAMMIVGALVNAILRFSTEKKIALDKPPTDLNPVDEELRKEIEDQGLA